MPLHIMRKYPNAHEPHVRNLHCGTMTQVSNRIYNNQPQVSNVIYDSQPR